LQQLSPDSSSTAEPLSIDITSEESIATAFKEVQEQHGRVEILVNNAGTFPTSQMIRLSAQCSYRLTLWHVTGLALDTAVTSGQLSPREGWNQTYNVNVTGTHLFTSAFVPLLLASQAQTKRLIFITSGLSSITEHASGTSPRLTA
jgi:NAD(P)-dependent dehydrogenase (short-subunit alcohol dehydrogenase family)